MAFRKLTNICDQFVDQHRTWGISVEQLPQNVFAGRGSGRIGILDELPGTNTYIGRLLLNYEDMEDALAPYYGDDAEVLGDLIKDHLTIAADILTALNNGQPTHALIASWYANAHDIAVQMNKMNPKSWPLEETEQMWTDHLDATLAEATDHFTGDFAGEVAAYDQVHDMALEMADFISNGVMKQFPTQFTGSLH